MTLPQGYLDDIKHMSTKRLDREIQAAKARGNEPEWLEALNAEAMHRWRTYEQPMLVKRGPLPWGSSSQQANLPDEYAEDEWRCARDAEA